MAQIVWTESALDDLDDIAEYIAIDKLSAAQQLVIDIFKQVDRLADQPRSGRKIPELTPSRYKEVIIGPCRIMYRATDDTVYILHVLRVEQELRRFLLQHRDPGD